ncbi:tryptophan--tRNA ligase [Rugosimonospora acidiphila]|uniref:Tryptophan--tRNA ligase n=1 Tax=Rugosimonospora acidiphila TaxID=556531 RepID=A0ABP9RRW5_9ACTN
MSRQITGLKPTGHLQLGNYLGAIAPAVRAQHQTDLLVFVADLHALTVDHDPGQLSGLTREVATLLLAAGLDPAHCTLFVQSQVPEHVQLHYLLECAATYGEAHRMIQFKEKAKAQQQVRLSLLSYPVLMASDILLHDIDEVPVGDDQSQHLELTRDVATRFNAKYGHTFVVPKMVHQVFAARLMDLSDPSAKMGKTGSSGAGVLFLLDPPEALRRKVMRATTDAGREVSYDRAARPGVANLLDLLASLTDGSPQALADQFSSYAELKGAVADAVIETVRPIQRRYAELTADPAQVDAVLREGASRARDRASATVRRTTEALGLLTS